MNRRVLAAALAAALSCPGIVSAQVETARLSALEAPTAPAPLTAFGASAAPGSVALAAPALAASLSAAPYAASFAEAPSAAAAAAAPDDAAAAPAARPAPAAVAARATALAQPNDSADAERAEAGRLFDNDDFAPQAVERLKTLAGRALTLPSHAWPFSRLARLAAHGEPFVGLTPGGAARAAERSADDGGLVIGRLAWELRDAWSVRGAERSYLNLIARLREAKARRPGLDAAVSVDAESLGLQLRGVPAAERERIAGDALLRIARAAQAAGVPLEIDMGTADALPAIVRIAGRVVRETRAPVRLALAARYGASEAALKDWAALAEETGLPLGVRLVKGSFIEARVSDAVNRRGPLMERYKRLITLALESGGRLDVAVASHNAEIWEHARRESRRLGADFKMHVIRGVALPLQAQMRAAGKLGRQYVSYGPDAPVMGLTELYTNWRQKRLLAASGGPID